jgi:hypothetical protein
LSCWLFYVIAHHSTCCWLSCWLFYVIAHHSTCCWLSCWLALPCWWRAAQQYLLHPCCPILAVHLLACSTCGTCAFVHTGQHTKGASCMLQCSVSHVSHALCAPATTDNSPLTLLANLT